MRDFSELNRLLDIRRVAEDYGLQVNRQGFANCPFHSERTASLKLYEDSFFCFGCRTGGDAIALVAGIRGISQAAAFDELDERYSLGLSDHKTAPARKTVRPRYEEWKQHALDVVGWYCRACWQILFRTEDVAPEVRSFFQRQSEIAEAVHQEILELSAFDSFKQHREDVRLYEQLREEFAAR